MCELNLSQGEAKTLLALRAIFSKKSVLLIDEVFSEIDSTKVKNILNVLKEKNSIIIVITHEKEIIDLCDEIIDLGVK